LRRRTGDSLILLMGPANDPPLRAIAAALKQVHADYICLNGNLEIAKGWLPNSEAVLTVHGREMPLGQLQSAYLRPFGLSTEDGKERKALETLLAWADLTTIRIVNRPAASLPNNSKPLQGQWIRTFGLRIPETLVTTDPEAAREFSRRHGEVVYKSISGVRSIVRRLGNDRYPQLNDVANCPTQFQRYIRGDDLRVHVIGETVHTLRIQSNCDDYRYAARNGAQVKATEVELDPPIAQSLRTIVRQMGLWVAGVDLRRTPAGEIYCLEINPSPAFTYYEGLAGIRLAGEVAALLIQCSERELGDPR
jgi:glutathione synthase/RimK-type ligase-like ATP-grasp enzyme